MTLTWGDEPMEAEEPHQEDGKDEGKGMEM
jgi:hypothetical protein